MKLRHEGEDPPPRGDLDLMVHVKGGGGCVRCSCLIHCLVPGPSSDDYGHSLRTLWDWLADAAPKAAACCGEIIGFYDCLLWWLWLLLLVRVHWHRGVSLLIWIVLRLHLHLR